MFHRDRRETPLDLGWATQDRMDRRRDRLPKMATTSPRISRRAELGRDVDRSVSGTLSYRREPF